jgi:lysozyme
MKVSQQGLELIKAFEGFRSRAYQDVVGVWTIGYGTTRVDGQPVCQGMVCTREQAEEWLRKDVDKYLQEVSALINPKIKLTQNQIDAIASLVYNIGVGNFSRSTLLRLINAGDMEGAAKQFLRWNKAGGRVVEGLTRRRQAEAELFLTPDGHSLWEI